MPLSGFLWSGCYGLLDYIASERYQVHYATANLGRRSRDDDTYILSNIMARLQCMVICSHRRRFYSLNT